MSRFLLRGKFFAPLLSLSLDADVDSEFFDDAKYIRFLLREDIYPLLTTSPVSVLPDPDADAEGEDGIDANKF